jgi:hypothetical protein
MKLTFADGVTGEVAVLERVRTGAWPDRDVAELRPSRRNGAVARTARPGVRSGALPFARRM